MFHSKGYLVRKSLKAWNASNMLNPQFNRYGQLSGLVEPVAGLLGAALVAFIVPILPYALAFAAVNQLSLISLDTF